MNVPDIAIGLRAQKGAALCVAVALEEGEPRVLLSTVVATGAEGDRFALEPYAVASEMMRGGSSLEETVAAVAEGRRRQDAAMAEGLRAVAARLEAAPVGAALLVNRAGWVTDLLGYSLEWAEHVPVAEGLAVREAVRNGCRACNFYISEFDEKSILEHALGRFEMGATEVEARLKTLGANIGKPWRKEQKLACLAAWLALTETT